MIQTNKIAKKHSVNPNVLAEAIDDVTIIFDPENSLLLTLNNTSSYIFSSILQELEINTIIASYAEIFSTTQKVARQDYYSCIKKFKKLKIISG